MMQTETKEPRLTKFKTDLKNLWEKSGADRLSLREKWMIGLGSLFVVCFFLFQFVLMPFWESKENIVKSIARKEEDLLRIQGLRQDHLKLKMEKGNVQSRLKDRDANFTLFTFLDEQSGKAGVKKQIQYMKPSVIEGEEQFDESVVDLKIEKISLYSLVEFLLLIESEENVVYIKRMSIQENSEGQGYLDSLIQLATFTSKDQQ